MSDKEFYKLFGMDESKPYQGSEQFGQSLKKYSLKQEHFVQYSTTTSKRATYASQSLKH